MFFSDDFVIQRFLPERLGGAYLLREYYFLNDAEYLSVEAGSDPVMTSGEHMEHQPFAAVPDELRAIRQKLGLDYGKIDFAMVDGKPVAFDANKTIGTRSKPSRVTWEIARLMATSVGRMLSDTAQAPAVGAQH